MPYVYSTTGGASLTCPMDRTTAGHTTRYSYTGSSQQRAVAWRNSATPGYVHVLMDGNIDSTNNFRYKKYECQESPSGSGVYTEVLSYDGSGFNMTFNNAYKIFYRQDYLNYNIGSISGFPYELDFTWTGNYDDLCAAAYNYFYPPASDPPIYVGVNSKARQVTDMYVGVNGKARKVTAIYVGVNGKAREVFKST